MPFRKISIELVMEEGNADAWMKTMRGAIGGMDKHAPLKRLEILDEVSEEFPGYDPLRGNPVANVPARLSTCPRVMRTSIPTRNANTFC